MAELTMVAAEAQACNCIGPQNGDPLCPCMMRGVRVVDGRYVKTTDYGPVSPPPHTPKVCGSCNQPKSEGWTYCPYCGAQRTA